MHVAVQAIDRDIWRNNAASEGTRFVPEETPLALTYNGGTYAVMMGTPQNLEDFAVGFSVSEGIVKSVDDIKSLEMVRLDDGIELRMWLASEDAARINQRRRHIAGPTGCGICGVESIAEAVRPAAIVPDGQTFTPEQVMAAMQAIAPLQSINLQTRAVHAAAFWSPTGNLVALREDVGRHNALDKLAGALARSRNEPRNGMVLLTSRVSVEMVQKTAAMGGPVMVAVSAPTALAVRTAEAAGITLIAIARQDGFEIFSHGSRIVARHATEVADVA
ncbi:formate dehydrogenase accessory sulfurtransferase FdhD [Bradyrhizobium yuanmingense]|uniref:formate dehydrogenase accessory sulfurtransferase FdhD n=1 Tax=Bradyrhizobium yuanmingense TaxID=108015 RepID=UPI0023B94BB2|nr:formate dehydrogenase accessory sulfurtransferase FdhD [Bradyrhizobium yuanmingense]MDF0580262.1 formate dehydrogenase accessory sulfurtransferase FdhD [Bradyrhizobium yuanmingense]